MRLAPGILVLSLALALGCGGSSDEAAAPEPAPAAKPDPAPAPEPTPAPAAAAPDAAKGAPLYATYCSSCHGATGAGDGPVSAGLNPKPAAHTDAAYMGALSDEHIFKVTKEGGPSVGKSPLMAPWGGTLSDAQIHDLVAFVRTLAQ